MTERVALGPLELQSGARLAEVEVAFRQWGRPDGRNTIVVCHALTGDADATEWWSTLVGPGRPVDTDRLHVVCANLLGGCRGTTGPGSVDPATGEIYALDFPLPAVGDLVECHRRLLAALGAQPLAAIGGSLGGMQALEWSLAHPGELRGAAIIAATDALSAQNLALSTVAREAILRDPAFHDGRYAAHGTRPDDGLSVARMLGHVTYLSDDGMQARFGRERAGDGPVTLRGPSFQVERYLRHQAERFLERFDANSYLYLSRTMDGFDAFADAARAPRAAAAGTEHLVLSFDSDWRFSSAHSDRVAAGLRAGGAAVQRVDVPSSWGHDSFLLELPAYQAAVRAFLDRL